MRLRKRLEKFVSSIDNFKSYYKPDYTYRDIDKFLWLVGSNRIEGAESGNSNESVKSVEQRIEGGTEDV